MPAEAGPVFRRDLPTRLCYAAVASYAFWLYAFGPALALLRVELHISYTMIGVYSALWAGGAALAGVTFAAAARRLPRSALLWWSAAAATAGAGLFAGTHAVALTLLGAALLGFGGTTLLTCTQAVLSDRHGVRRDRALTEANVGAACCAVLAPLLLGLFQGTPAGWRVAMGLPAVVLGGLFLRYRRRIVRQGLGAAVAVLLAAGRPGRRRHRDRVLRGLLRSRATGRHRAAHHPGRHRPEQFLPWHPGRPGRRSLAHPRSRADCTAAVRIPGCHRRRLPALLAGRLTGPGDHRPDLLRARRG
jgi:MFS family permease